MSEHDFITSPGDDCLTDESGLLGQAEIFLAPKNKQDLLKACQYSLERESPVTVQGSRTGLCGGAVPCSGTVLSLGLMKQIHDFRFDPEGRSATLLLDPGVTLKEINTALADKHKHENMKAWGADAEAHWATYAKSDLELFFPPNPTEDTATIGGIVACNASGSHLYAYGEARRYVQALELVQADSTVLRLSRSADLKFMPYAAAAGLADNDEAESIDLICGSEGTLGIISEITVSLIEKPAHEWGLLLFFTAAENMIAFIDQIESAVCLFEDLSITSMDFFNHAAMKLAGELQQTLPAFRSLPKIDGIANFCLYLQIAGKDEENLTEFLEELLIQLDSFSEDADAALVASSGNELVRFKSIWHAIVEGTKIHKQKNPQKGDDQLMLDLLVAPHERAGAIKKAQEESAAHEGALLLFGHIGNHHLHLHYLAESGEQRKSAKEKMARWIQVAAANHWPCASEFGIGRSRRDVFARLSPGAWTAMKRQKACYDPHKLINPAVMIGQDANDE